MTGAWWRRVKVQLSYELEVQRLIARQLEQLVQTRPGPCAILDVGCGTTSMLAVFQQSPLRARCRLTGLDAHEPTITWCRAHGFHDAYLQGDVRDPALLPESDIIVATDLVEHLEKAEALNVLSQLEARSTRAVLVLTPNGYLPNPHPSDNPYMAHRCGFSSSELERLGYVCRGLGGPRQWRGPHALPRGPKLLTMPALAVASRLMRRWPAPSFHLLALKPTGGPGPWPSTPPRP